jgi:hypothetical protein
MRRSLLVIAAALAATAAPSYAGADPAVSAGHSARHSARHSAERAVQRGVKPVPVPKAARGVDTTHPNHVIGNGSPAGCTSRKVVRAVAKGGVITFDCGPAPVTITMTATAKVRNANQILVLDGGGTVTLSGAGKRRILYQNTCDKAQGWTTSHCQDQATPRLTVQNLVFAQGDSTGQTAEGLPVYVVGSTFEKGSCSNGGALSSLGVSWTVLNSVLKDNDAVGRGANPARSGTPGGGSGGAIYNDGDAMALTITGTLIEDNRAEEGGGAVFFVSNNRTGTVTIRNSTLRRNPSAGFETRPGIFFLGAKLSR